jgi:hypothetical protein
MSMIGLTGHLQRVSSSSSNQAAVSAIVLRNCCDSSSLRTVQLDNGSLHDESSAPWVRKHSLLSDDRVYAQQQLLLCEMYVFRHSKFNIQFCRAASRRWQLSSTAYSMYQHLKQFTAVSISAVNGLVLRRNYSTKSSTIPIYSCTIQAFGA